MGAGKKIWGYYPAGDVWLPLRCNAAGQLEVDMSNVDLGDLGDVNLAGIANGDGIYWNAAAGEWQVAAPPAFTCADLNACGLNDLGDVNLAGVARGDILRRGAAAWENYGLGAANTILTSNGTDPVWAPPPAAVNIASGSYTGDGTNNRQITTGFAVNHVWLSTDRANYHQYWVAAFTTRGLRCWACAWNCVQAQCVIHATDGFVVDNVNANISGQTYKYVAIG